MGNTCQKNFSKKKMFRIRVQYLCQNVKKVIKNQKNQNQKNQIIGYSSEETNALITNVDKSSPAYHAGIRA